MNTSGQHVYWRWIGIAFCFLTVFHLLPAVVARLAMEVGHVADEKQDTILLVWMYGGTSLVMFFLIHFTRGMHLFETAAGAIGYLLVEVFLFPTDVSLAPGHFSGLAMRLIAVLMAFACSALGGYLGSVVHIGKQQTG